MKDVTSIFIENDFFCQAVYNEMSLGPIPDRLKKLKKKHKNRQIPNFPERFVSGNGNNAWKAFAILL